MENNIITVRIEASSENADRKQMKWELATRLGQEILQRFGYIVNVGEDRNIAFSVNVKVEPLAFKGEVYYITHD